MLSNIILLLIKYIGVCIDSAQNTKRANIHEISGRVCACLYVCVRVRHMAW